MSRQYNNYGRDQINIEQAGDVHIHEQQQPDRPRNEQILLQAVGQEVESRLEQSLHNAILINLNKEAQPEQVNRPWDREIRIGLKPASPLPEDKTIAQVFDDAVIGGKLLILGQPGAGKTTTLLDLVKVLVDRAWADIYHPIPVLFNLSSWRDEKQPIREWIVAELRSKYGASRKLAQLWVNERQLLPLLDGLDEVAPERQEQCIIRINEFLQGEAAPLQAVVCSRLAEYENLNRQLQLNGAICLKALGDGQIQTYLEKVDRADLWQFLSQHSVLLEFVRAPLLLSVTVLAYPQHSEAQLQKLQMSNDPLPFLLDAYVERMLHRNLQDHTLLKLGWQSEAYRKRTPPDARETRHWLAWMARQMEERSQTEFLIEELQPSMLPEGQRWKYRAGVGLIVEPNIAPNVEFSDIKPVETLKLSWQRFRNRLISWLSAGLVAGLIFGLMAEPLVGLIYGLIYGLLVGLLVGLIFGLMVALFGETIDLKLSPNQGIKRSAKNFVIVWLIYGLPSGLVVGLLVWLIHGLLIGLLMGLMAGLCIWSIVGKDFGGTACIQHFVLRLVLYQNRFIPWNYARFLNYSTERLFLQRVGGRYLFIHKLLREHFAGMRTE